MTAARKSYVHSATGAVRKSSSPLGFPYVAMTDENAQKAGAAATAKANKKSTSTQGAKGPKGAAGDTAKVADS